ncbi:MAG: L-rhamnose catabolism isomerase [Bacteroidota bacterium]
MNNSGFRIPASLVEEENREIAPSLGKDYDALRSQLERRSLDIDALTRTAASLEVAVPSWGVGTGGTRFARFPGGGEPRNIHEKLVDCATIHQLTRMTPRVSLHIPWDKPSDTNELKEFAAALGLGFDAMNSNTFQDQPGQRVSYKYGSLTHTDAGVRREAIAHNKECIEIGKRLGSQALTVWIGDGANVPGQSDFRGSFERYLESTREIYGALPASWKMFLEYKPYEPAFYATVVNDWGTVYYATLQLGPQALGLVDLGHHLPNTNIEMIVSRLIQVKKLGGFHFNDSKYGDDDLDAGSIKPFQLFLIFHELVSASLEGQGGEFRPAYMIDQSHNITDPIESLMSSAEEIQRAYVQALLVDRKKLNEYQQRNDPLMAHRMLKEAFRIDVTPILQRARVSGGGAADPVATYRASRYRERKTAERPPGSGSSSGIV